MRRCVISALWAFVLQASTVVAQTSGQPATGTKPAQSANRHGRTVEVRWNLSSVAQASALEIWVDCNRTSSTALDECNEPGEKYAGPEAFAFLLTDSDAVVLIVRGTVASEANERLDAQYAVTGVNVDDSARQQLAKLFPSASSTAKPAAGGISGERITSTIVVVTDNLLAGGRLTVTFRRIQTDNSGKEAVIASTSPVVFRVKRRQPWFAFSVGLGITRAPNPSVEIVKTSTIVSFNKDGKPQQAYQAAVHIKDAEASFRPIDTAVAFLNFKLAGPTFVSLGLPTNQTFFTQPLLGGSIRIPAGSLGLVLTAGAHFTRETRIVPASGFADSQLLDPTLGLTAGDVPTETNPHQRFFFAFSIHY